MTAVSDCDVIRLHHPLKMIFLFCSATDAHGRGLLYSGISDCFIKIYEAEGFFGLYKGVGANYLRLAPHGAFCLIFWDVLKDLQEQYL